jgi:hypothetical protein
MGDTMMTKPQCPCSYLIAFPVLPGQSWHPEDSARLFRFLLRPLIGAVVILLVGALLLFAARYSAPFMVGTGIGSPSHMASQSPQFANEERRLDAEIEQLLASFEVQGPQEPSTTTQLP